MYWCSVLFGDTELSLRAPNLLAHGVYREPLTRADADYIHARGTAGWLSGVRLLILEQTLLHLSRRR